MVVTMTKTLFEHKGLSTFKMFNRGRVIQSSNTQLMLGKGLLEVKK